MPYLLVYLLFFGSAALLSAVERFGEIAVAPQSLGSGDTRHGYIEHRVGIANESATRTHTVTLVYPENSSGGGDYLARVTRSAKLGPNSSVTLRFWQPALPVFGSTFGIYVDGRHQGEVAQASYNNHARNRYGSGVRGATQRVYLISRSLNGDDLEKPFYGEPNSPLRVTGEPDASSGLRGAAWIPAETNGIPEWLELDYPAGRARQIQIYETENHGSVAEVVLFNTNGLPIATVKTAGHSRQQGNLILVDFPLTAAPVGRVRLNLSPRKPGIGPSPIDAVLLVGQSKNAWAVGARASSFLDVSSIRSPGIPPGVRPGIPPSVARRYGLAATAAESLYRLVLTELEPDQWSDHWLAYTAYDAVLMTAKDHAAMPESARLALWRYAECGGCLVVFGKIETPEPWRSQVTPSLQDAQQVFVGFGRVMIFNATEIKQLSISQGRPLDKLTREAAWPWVMEPGDLGSLNAAFPVMADIHIPFRGMAMILLLFVLLIGPVNLLLLMWYRKRIWSLWTIPVISFTTCALVFVYSFLSEGITPRTRMEGLVLLDQVNHRATTLGMAAYYCPLTPSDGLRFSYDTEVSPMLNQQYNRYGNAHEMDWTQSQHFRRGWLASRVPAFFRMRKSETRRERLQLESAPNGQLAAVNGLGAQIQSLRLTDFSGRNYTATNVMPGQKVILQSVPTVSTTEPNPNLLPDFYRLAGWAPAEAVWQKLSTNALPPGSYLAHLSSAPFLEEALAGKTIAKRASVVLGILNRHETSIP